MSNPYSVFVSRGGADTENVRIMQQPVLQTEAVSMPWSWKKKAPPADAAHVLTASQNLQDEYNKKVQEIHALKLSLRDKDTKKKTEIDNLNTTILQKERQLTDKQNAIVKLTQEISHFEDIEKMSYGYLNEIKTLKTQISKFVDNHEYIGTASATTRAHFS